MNNPSGFTARKARFLNRFHARMTARGQNATGFVSTPEPRTIGSFAKGKQLLAGNYVFAGHLVEAPGVSLWDVVPPDAEYLTEIHGFSWLDDLASVGDAPARELAQIWLSEWVDRFGRGRGPGWTPDLTGRRLIRWINHAVLLLQGRKAAQSAAFFQSLSHQTRFLSRRWHGALPGVPKFEALTGLIYSSLALMGFEALAEPAVRALAQEAADQIGAEGALPTRNPEELLDVFVLLTWAAVALEDANKRVPPAHFDAIERITPTLRALRHSDGSLARFHGGGRGREGWLDQALATSGIKTQQNEGLSMGYARLSAGRTSVIVDASPPPSGQASFNAHASTLAFELTSGRRPLIVSCGSGAAFGSEWRRAARTTPSHSALVLDGQSSAAFGPAARGSAQEALVNGPEHVPVEMSQAPDGLRFQGGHDGFAAAYGLTHARSLELTFDGRSLSGEDMLLSLQDTHKRQFDKAMDAVKLKGIPFEIRFHLHPEVDAALDMNGSAVSIALKSGEIWVFRQDGAGVLTLQPSVYLEQGRLKPRNAQQIVLAGRATEYGTRIRWSFAKAQDTAIGVRDLTQDTPYWSDEL